MNKFDNILKTGTSLKTQDLNEVNKSGFYLLESKSLLIKESCVLIGKNIDFDIKIRILKNLVVQIVILDEEYSKIWQNSNIEVICEAGVELNFYRYSIVENNNNFDLSAKLVVGEASQNCNLSYVHKTLCLNDNFDITSRPELIIKNGNVKCRHSSTFLNIPKNVADYLSSRGILPDEIKEIYKNSFIQSLCDLVLMK